MKVRHRVLGLLVLLAVITYIDRVCISVAGKTIQDDLRLTPSQWGWVLGAFALAYGIFEVPMGALGDRIGPRRVLTRIVIWWSAFTGLTGLATGFWQLVATRFLFGAGEAGAFPNASAAIARWFPSVERAGAQGFVWMATRLGGALSPVLVIPLQQTVGWRASFFIFAGLGVGWGFVWFWWFRDDPKDKHGVPVAEIAELGEARVLNSHDAVPWRAFIRWPNLWWIMVMYFAYVWGAFFYLSWLFTFLENGRGFSKAELLAWSWLPFVLGAGANVAGGFTSDWLVRKIGLTWGRRLIGMTGLGVSALLIGAATLTQHKILTLVLLALGYASSDFMLPVAWAVCLDVGGRRVGIVSGAMNTAGSVAAFGSAVAFGYIVSVTGSYDAPLVLMAILTVVAALAWLRIDPLETLSAR
jgi:ACS family glucarate transporter-like MFS transporter